MFKRFHKIARVLAVAVLLVVIAGVGAPYLRADYFAARIKAGLEQSLGRKVEIGNARYNVFTGPGFQVEEVTIAEDPRIGIEPFAHVSEVHARVDPWSLLRGEIRFSNLRLVEPTVNFSRTEAGQWNVELFLERTSAAQLPPMQIRQGRVNFKFGDRKSIYYLGNADLDIANGSATNALQLVASVEPFRTDRPATTVGRFHLRAAIRGGTLDGELEGERASIPEIAKLIGGRDPGLKGFASTALRLNGPMNAVAISGEVKMDDLSGSILLPRLSAAAALPVKGTLDLRGHTLELESAPPQGSDKNSPLPVTIRMHAREYFAKPEWSGEIKFEGFAAPAMFEIARRLGANVPEGFSVEKGSFSGDVTFDLENGVKGDITLTGGDLKLPSGGELTGAEFRFGVTGRSIDLSVHSAALEEEQSRIRIEGSYELDSRTLDIRMQTSQKTGMSVVDTLKLIPDSPLLRNVSQGSWRGKLRYTASFQGADAPEPAWSGRVEVLNGRVTVEGLASPVDVTFTASQDETGKRMVVKPLKGSCGKLQFTGDYRYEQGAARPHKLNLVAEKVNLGELEQTLRPVLARGGFLSKTLRIGKAPVPAWLAARHVEGTVKFQSVSAGAAKFEKFHAKYQWDGVKAVLQEASIAAAGGEEDAAVFAAAEGDIQIDLSGNQPRYQAKGALRGVPLAASRFDLEGTFETSGLGEETLLALLQSKGEFHSASGAGKVRFTPEWTFDEASGNYTAAATQNGPAKLTVTDLNLTQGSDAYQGQGSTQADGKLALEINGPKKQARLVGSLTASNPRP
jgi:hypothetical protein